MYIELEIDYDRLHSLWNEDDWNHIENMLQTLSYLLPEIHSYPSFAEYVANDGVFRNIKELYKRPIDYGYANSRESLKKFLLNNNEYPDGDYLVILGAISREDEKYYKKGTYINHDGFDTVDDYWGYIEDHPDEENFIDDDCKKNDFWITYTIYRKIS